MDSDPLIQWQSWVYCRLKPNCFTNVLREMTHQEQGGLAKSLILKDKCTDETVAHLFFVRGSICARKQWPPKEIRDKSTFITSRQEDGIISIPNSKDFQLEPKVHKLPN